MLKQDVKKNQDYVIVSLEGRIDGMTTPLLNTTFQEQINAGLRKIAVDLGKVHYISSVGLRVFLILQKQLSRVSGKLVLRNPSQEVMQVFDLSGFTKLFTFLDKDAKPFTADGEELNSKKFQLGKLQITAQEFEVIPGKLSKAGNSIKLARAEYEESDVVEIDPSAAQFGLGLAALGKDFVSYSPFFGEAMVIDHCNLVYPAAANANVDMMLGGTADYHFLNGFYFQGEFSSINLIESEEFISLDVLVDFVQQKAQTPLSGVVFIAECKGLWGINLKKAPLKIYNPENIDIMQQDNFARWFNFSIEPEHIDQLVMGCGIIKKPDSVLPAEFQDIADEYHLHAAVFPEAILNKNHCGFAKEFKNILMEYDCKAVYHLLKKSQFSSLMLGIIPLQVAGV